MSAPGICLRRPCRPMLRLQWPGRQICAGLVSLPATAWSFSTSRDLAATNKKQPIDAANQDLAKTPPRKPVARKAKKPSALGVAATAGLISTPEALADLLAELTRPSSPPTSLYLDLEGHWLSRVGCLDILTILRHPQGTVHLVDVFALQHAAFTTPSTTSRKLTLQAILEDPLTPKYLWDVRNDADALHAHYGVRLRGATDLQVLENAARGGTVDERGRPRSRKLLWSLASCIQRDLDLPAEEMAAWTVGKDKMRALMNLKVTTGPAAVDPAAVPEQPVLLAGNLLAGKIPLVLLDASARRSLSDTSDNNNNSNNNSPGQEQQDTITTTPAQKTSGSRVQLRPVLQPPAQIDLADSIFRRRPLSAEMAAYCANDVLYLPALHAVYLRRLQPASDSVSGSGSGSSSPSPWHALVQRETDRRCEAVLPGGGAEYDAHGANKVLAPWDSKVAAMADAGEDAGVDEGSSAGE